MRCGTWTGAASEGGAARWDAGSGGSGGDRCVWCRSGWCRRWPGPGWCQPAPPACCGDAAAGRGCIRSSPVAGRGRGGISCPLCQGGSGEFPGMSPALDVTGVPDPAQWSPAVFPARLVLSGFHGGRRLSAVLPGHRMTDARLACRITIAVLAGPPFPLVFREEKELMGRGISTAMTGVVAESALPSGGTAMGGEPGQRGCKHPGCGNPVPVSGRDRTRVFCSDACSRRFHNAARSAGGDGETVSPRCRFRAGSRFHVRLFRAGNQGGAIWRSAAGCPIIPDRSRSSSPTWAVSAPTCSRSGTSGCPLTWTTSRWSCRSRPADPSTAQK